jgi:CBS domain-containing protein
MKTYMIGDRMIRHPFVIGTDDSLEEAIKSMRENDIRHLPVVLNDRLVGIVSERDLKAAESLEKASLLTVGDIMKVDLFVVTKDTPLANVASEMADGKLGSAIIVDRSGKIEGIVTTTDALRMLSELIEDQTIESFISVYDEYEDGLMSVTG